MRVIEVKLETEPGGGMPTGEALGPEKTSGADLTGADLDCAIRGISCRANRVPNRLRLPSPLASAGRSAF